MGWRAYAVRRPVLEVSTVVRYSEKRSLGGELRHEECPLREKSLSRSDDLVEDLF